MEGGGRTGEGLFTFGRNSSYVRIFASQSFSSWICCLYRAFFSSSESGLAWFELRRIVALTDILGIIKAEGVVRGANLSVLITLFRNISGELLRRSFEKPVAE